MDVCVCVRANVFMCVYLCVSVRSLRVCVCQYVVIRERPVARLLIDLVVTVYRVAANVNTGLYFSFF